MRAKPILDWLRKALTENIGLKLLSIVAAVVLFSIVRGSEDAERTMFVDVVATLPPDDSEVMLVSERPDRVRLTLTGSRALLNSIRREEIEPLEIDLTDTDARYYYFNPANMPVPAGVQVDITPASLELQWAERVERRVPVDPQFEGDPGRGLSISDDVTVQPERVLVTGPQYEVDPLNTIHTEPIAVEGLSRGRHERRVRLQRPAPHASYVGEPVIRVSYEVEADLEERVLEGIEVVGTGSGDIEVRPARVRVVVEALPAVMRHVDRESVVAWVDSGDPEESGTWSLPVEVRGLPPGADIVRIEPPEALVTVTR